MTNLRRIAWLTLAVGTAGCGAPPPAEQPLRVQAPSGHAEDVGPEPSEPPCALTPDDTAELIWVAGPGGTSVSHPKLGFSFALPQADFKPAPEDRPLMLSALREDERTVSHPCFDDFSRSFVVVRIVALDTADAGTLRAYLQDIEKDLEAGVRAELGPETSIGPWKRLDSSSGKTFVASESVFDERLYVSLRAWPLDSRASSCARAVVLIGVSISPQEMPTVMDSFGILQY